MTEHDMPTCIIHHDVFTQCDMTGDKGNDEYAVHNCAPDCNYRKDVLQSDALFRQKTGNMPAGFLLTWVSV